METRMINEIEQTYRHTREFHDRFAKMPAHISGLFHRAPATHMNMVSFVLLSAASRPRGI
jgi:hypothetical protein